MTDDAQTSRPEEKTACLKKINKTPRILLAGVLLIIAANYLLKITTLRIEPIDSWNPETLLVIRKERNNEFWPGVRDVLGLLDANLNTSLSKIKLKTGTDPLLSAEILLPEPVELLVIKNRDSEKKGLAKYDYVLVTKASGKGIENLPAADTAARDFFSWYAPTKEYATLDDGSRIKSQVADPAFIKIKTEDFRGVEIVFISEPGIPFEYARTHHEGWLFFSTSKKSLEDLLSRDNQTVPFKTFSRNCASLNGSVRVFLNPEDFNVSNRPNTLMLWSPIRLFLGLLSPNKAKISSKGVSIDWDSCRF